MTDKLKLATVNKLPDLDEPLRQWLIDHMAEHGHLTAAVLSRSEYTGVSRPALEAFIAGTWFLSKDAGGKGIDPARSNIEERIGAYRLHIEGPVRQGRKNTFLHTRTYEQLRQAWATARKENAIVVVYGRPGVGKTRSLTEISIRETQGNVPVNIVCSPNITPKYFLQKIARSIGVSDKASIPQLEDLIAEKLKRSPRDILVDQANYLNDKSLGSICQIWDIAQVPIVLVGTKLLHDLFFASRLTEDVRAQLSRRIAIHYPLDELTPGQAKAILKDAIPALSDSEIGEIVRVTGGVHGHLELIITRLLDLRKRNEKDLQTGTVKMPAIIQMATARLMIA